jgi:pimeloyl-ACP methyl ester carboxylesterase
VFDGLQAQLAANRLQFYRNLPEGPFYGFNRPDVKASKAIIQNWWRQGMMGGAKAHYDGTDDLKKITVPVLVMHGDDDQIVPYADAGQRGAHAMHLGVERTCVRQILDFAEHLKAKPTVLGEDVFASPAIFEAKPFLVGERADLLGE